MKILKFLLVVLCFGVSFAHAQTTVPLPLDDKAYEQLDVLRGSGLIVSQIVGARPYSRSEVARLVKEAGENFDGKNIIKEKSQEYIGEILEELNNKFAREIKLLDENESSHFYIKPIENVAVEFAALNDDARAVPGNNGLGPIAAKFQPLAFFKEGRDYVDGAQYNISSRHWLELSPYFNLSVAPRIQFEFPHNKPLDQDQFFVDELQATAQFKNVRLSVGRAPLVLGQSSYGGFILSTNARAVDQIILSNDHPFRFPWIFKYLGDQKLVAYFGTLGPEYSFKNTLLSGYKWTLKPLNNWEMGLSNVMTIGGEGAPSFGALDFIGDFAGFSGTSNSVSNRILGFDTRVGIPKLNGLEIYAEAFWDDKTFKSLKRTLIDTSEYKLGFYLPTLTSNGRLSGRLELKYISELFYRHSQFQSGYTLNNEILGDPLGPDGKSVDVNFDYAWNNKAQSQLKLTYITSDSNTYSNTGNSINKTADGLKETHFMFGLNQKYQIKKIDLLGSVLVDYVTNKDFVANKKLDYFLSTRVKYDF